MLGSFHSVICFPITSIIQVPWLSPFYSWGHLRSERSSNLSRVTQIAQVKQRWKRKSFWLQAVLSEYYSLAHTGGLGVVFLNPVSQTNQTRPIWPGWIRTKPRSPHSPSEDRQNENIVQTTKWPTIHPSWLIWVNIALFPIMTLTPLSLSYLLTQELLEYSIIT